MKTFRLALLAVAGLLAVVSFCLAADAPAAKDADNDKAADTDKVKEKDIKASFVRVLEQMVNERKYTGIEIKPDGTGDAVTVLIPLCPDEKNALAPDTEKLAVVRSLQAGQMVQVTYYVQDAWNWVRSIEAISSKGDAVADKDKTTDKAQDYAKDTAKGVKKDNNNRRNANRYYDRRYNQYRRAVHHTAPKPQPSKDQTKPVTPPKGNTSSNPQKIQ